MNDDHGSIEQGTIGWGDRDDYFDIGEGDNENLPLFRVTLTRGRNVSRDIEDRAQGAQVLCRWGIPIDFVPAKGWQCVVAFPAGMREIDGGGVITGIIKPNGSQFKADRAVLDLGPDVHVLLKGKSVTLSDYASPARWLTVGVPRQGGPAGLTAMDETGSGWTIQAGVIGMFSASGGDVKTIFQVKATEIGAAMKDGSASFKLKANHVITFAQNNIMSGICYLGKAPVVANTALWGPGGPTGAPSPSVFISAI